MDGTVEAKISQDRKLGVIFPSGTIHREASELFVQCYNTMLVSPVKVIVVSFAGVHSLLSDGIRTLIVMNDTAQKHHKIFCITDLPKEVKYTLQITNLLGILPYNPLLGNILKKLNLTRNDLRPVDMDELGKMRVRPAATATSGKKSASPAAAEAAPAPQAVVSSPVPQVPASSATPVSAAGASVSAKVNPPSGPAAGTPRRSLGDKHTASIGYASEVKLATVNLTDEEMKQIIKTHIPGRLALEIIDAVLRLNKDVFTAESLSSRLRGGDEKTIKKTFKRLQTLGTIMPVGGGMYNYGVSRPIRLAINAVIAAFENRKTHSKVLKMLLDAENF